MGWRTTPHFVYSKALYWLPFHRGLEPADRCMRKAPERRWQRARDEMRDAMLTEGYDADRGAFLQALTGRTSTPRSCGYP